MNKKISYCKLVGQTHLELYAYRVSSKDVYLIGMDQEQNSKKKIELALLFTSSELKQFIQDLNELLDKK